MEQVAVKQRDGSSDVRERLLEAATQLFAQKGYAATSVREIVAAAGVTPPVLYYYFQSKEGIYRELMREAWEAFDALLQEVEQGAGGAWDKILRLASRVFCLFCDRIALARIMYSLYYGPPQGAPPFDFDAYHKRFREAVLGLVEEGIRRGEFRQADTMSMAWAISGAINIAMEVELCHPELSLGWEGLSRVLGHVFEGIGVRKRDSEEGQLCG